MKIIDLLVKISKDEEVPRIIKYNDDIYIYCKPCQIYELEGNEELCGEDLYHRIDNLNDEVEIIEEDKKIEKIEKLPIDVEYVKVLIDKINEIIDIINKEEN